MSGRREGEMALFFFERAAHWYDSLIFRVLVWSGLRGHPSIIELVTSSLSSSSAPTLRMCASLYVCMLVHMCVEIHVSHSVCVCVRPLQTLCPHPSFKSRITCEGMWSRSSCRPGNAPRQRSGIESYQASTPRYSTQRRTGHMQGVCVRSNNPSCCQ